VFQGWLALFTFCFYNYNEYESHVVSHSPLRLPPTCRHTDFYSRGRVGLTLARPRNHTFSPPHLVDDWFPYCQFPPLLVPSHFNETAREVGVGLVRFFACSSVVFSSSDEPCRGLFFSKNWLALSLCALSCGFRVCGDSDVCYRWFGAGCHWLCAGFVSIPLHRSRSGKPRESKTLEVKRLPRLRLPLLLTLTLRFCCLMRSCIGSNRFSFSSPQSSRLLSQIFRTSCYERSAISARVFAPASFPLQALGAPLLSGGSSFSVVFHTSCFIFFYYLIPSGGIVSLAATSAH